MHRARYVGRSAELPRALLAHCSPGTSCSPTWRLSKRCTFGIFYGGFIMWGWLTINAVLSPCPLPGGWGCAASSRLLIMDGLFFRVTSPHPEAAQEPTQSRLLGTKDSPVTQEIPRDIGPQSQELGAEINIYIYIFLLYHRYIIKSGISGLCANSVFNISRNSHTVFQSGYTINLLAFTILFLLFGQIPGSSRPPVAWGKSNVQAIDQSVGYWEGLCTPSTRCQALAKIPPSGFIDPLIVRATMASYGLAGFVL